MTSVSRFVKTGVYQSMFRLVFFHFNVSDLSKLGAGIDVIKAPGICERGIEQVDVITLGAMGQHILLQLL
jgi:hypothetical protein